MLPAVRGILPRTDERVHTDEPDDLPLVSGERALGKMPNGAGNMPALPKTAETAMLHVTTYDGEIALDPIKLRDSRQESPTMEAEPAK